MVKHNDIPNAIAAVSGSASYPDISGTVKFFSLGSGTLVVADIKNLPMTKTGFFAFHIHEGGNCRDNFDNVKGHYNPQEKEHPNHSGDLPPLLYCRGKAFSAVMTDRFTVDEIAGRTVIIHSSFDDFKTQPSGDAKEKIACGEIKLIKE